ncbi:MAG: hypothetical protein ACRDSJ_15510 [Rubrobacteraceae bacterium]
MADRKEISKAADRLAAAAEEFARQIEDMESSVPLSEEEADALGVEAVHRTRSEWLTGAGGFDREEITEEEAREWVRRREERRRREGHKPI